MNASRLSLVLRGFLLIVSVAAAIAYFTGYWPKFQGPPKTPWVAIHRGDLDALKAMVEANPEALRETSHTETLLHTAAYVGNPEIIKYLLSQGLDAAARDHFEQTPLHEAAYGGSPGAAALLLKAAPTLVHATDKLGQTPLHIAAGGMRLEPADAKQVEVARLLIRHGADVHAVDESGDTPLHCAARTGSLEAAKLLLRSGADPAVRQDQIGRQPDDPKSFSALQYAARQAHVEVVELLLEHGAPVVYQRFQKWHWAESALHDACNPSLGRYEDGNGELPPGFTRDLETIDLLLARVGDPNIEAHTGPGGRNTPLQVAAASGSARIVRHLIENYPLVDAAVEDSYDGRRSDITVTAPQRGRSVDRAINEAVNELVRRRAELQRAGRAPGQEGDNTPPTLVDLAYVPPEEGPDAGGHVTGTIADETRRPGSYRIEVDFEGDGQQDTFGRYPADDWGFSYEVHLPSGERELWFRVVERPRGLEEPAASEWTHFRFTAVAPPNEPPWMYTFFFRDGNGDAVEISGVFHDLTGEGSDYRVEVDMDGDGRADIFPEHHEHPENAMRDDWGIQKVFRTAIETPAGREAVRVRIVELRKGEEVASTDWIAGREPSRP